MSIKSKIVELVLKYFPAIGRLIAEKIIPRVTRKAYEALNSFADDRLEDLSDLLDKALSEKDPDKKERHIKGLKLGSSALKAVANKILEACALIDKEISEEE